MSAVELAMARLDAQRFKEERDAIVARLDAVLAKCQRQRDALLEARSYLAQSDPSRAYGRTETLLAVEKVLREVEL